MKTLVKKLYMNRVRYEEDDQADTVFDEQEDGTFCTLELTQEWLDSMKKTLDALWHMKKTLEPLCVWEVEVRYAPGWTENTHTVDPNDNVEIVSFVVRDFGAVTYRFTTHKAGTMFTYELGYLDDMRAELGK